MKSSLDILWAVSLIVIGIASLILAGTAIFGIEPPDALRIALGLADLVAIPVLSFTTVKKVQQSKK